MDIQSTNLSFQHYCYGGIHREATRDAVNLVRKNGSDAIQGLKTFVEKHSSYPNYSYDGNFLQRTLQQFRHPRWAVFDNFRVAVRKPKEATNGVDTLVVQSKRFMSGKDIHGATVEVELPQPLTAENMVKALENAENKSRQAIETNYKAKLINNPKLAIAEDLTKA